MAIATAMAMAMAMGLIINKMINGTERCARTDLHTHILPAFDDGAQSIEMALHMLRIQKKNGIERVVLTPHYYPMREDLEAFLDRRQHAYASLLTHLDDKTMPQIRLGAEVCYTPDLIQMDLRRLTIGNGNYLLLELPDMGVVAYVIQIVENMLTRGIIPVLAHIERCLVLRDNPELLFELIQMGVLAQIDAETLTGKRRDSFALQCLNKGLAHVIASDMHNLSDRSICLADVSTEQNKKILIRAEGFARAIWDGTSLPAFDIKPLMKSFFGHW